jgi:outer membrane protein TolC
MRKWISVIMLSFFIIATTSQGIIASESLGDKTVPGKTFTIEQAVDLALINSNTIKSADYDIERGEEVRNSTADNVKYIPFGADSDAQATKALTGLVSADTSWRMTKKTRTVEGDKLVLSVYNKYTSIIKAIENLNYAQETLKNTQWQWNIAQISYQAGITSQTQKNASDTQLKSAQNSLRLAEITLDSEYQAFNKIIGLNSTERPVLTEKPDYSLLKIENLETEVHRALESSPSLWTLDQNVSLAQLQLDFYDSNSASNENYRVKEIDLRKAELSNSDTYKQVAQGVRDLYNSICKLEGTYNIQQQAIKKAEDNLGVQKLMFDIGMVTKTDVQSAELDLQKAKKDLNETIYQHEYLKLQFAKPWAA